MLPPIPKQWRTGPVVRPGGAIVAALLLAGLLALAGCEGADDFELEGELGPGSGGSDVNPAALASHDLMNFSGETVIGTMQYDSSVLLHFHPDPENEALHVIANITPEQLIADLADDGVLNGFAGDDVAIFITPIVGRADTPCRFQAALLARDEKYSIQGSGDRKTDSGRDLHQVNLIKPSIPQTQRFYCYELDDPFGAQLNVIAMDAQHQEWLVVHAVLNSIAKQ